MSARLLAFDTATEHLSIALEVDGEVFTHEGEGGSKASATLIPAIMALLARAGVTFRSLDAIAFGRGPGAFTGLRTACAVAQGLAFGAAKPVLPIDTLLAVAEDARGSDPHTQHVWAVMDARMSEVYAAQYAFADNAWAVLDAPMLTTPDALAERWRRALPGLIAGNALGVFADAWRAVDARFAPDALSRARAMLPLAQTAWRAGAAVDPALALPLYLRDKIAQTTSERDATRAAKLAAAEAPR